MVLFWGSQRMVVAEEPGDVAWSTAYVTMCSYQRPNLPPALGLLRRDWRGSSQPRCRWCDSHMIGCR